VHWVEKSAGVFLPGDLALPGDSIRVIVDASAANVAAWHNDLYRVHPGPAASALHALGPAHDGRALYVGWPHPFTGSCWRCGDAG
jgi:hypothetical protein